MSEFPVYTPEQGGFRANVGPASVSATGNTVVQTLLAIFVIGSSCFVVWTTNQQTILLTQQHDALQAQLAANALLVMNLTRASENVFLSALLPNEKKKEVPSFIQDRAKEIIQQRANTLTENRANELPRGAH